MRFANPQFLLFTVIFISVCVFVWWSMHVRNKILRKLAEQKLLSQLLDTYDHRRTLLKSVLVMLAVFFLLVSLLQPQWGFGWQQVKRKGVDIMIALDTSKSMLAQDIKPNRLERSKLAIRDMVRLLHGDRVGLIAFSGSAFLQCPLTVDYDGFLLALDDLSNESIPREGTAIAQAISDAQKGFSGRQSKNKILVIITDGENHEGDPYSQALAAAKDGVIIYCIGIGTTEGELIWVTDEHGQKQYVKDKQGNVVKTRLNEEILQKIALATGGSYVRASATEFGLELLYKSKFSAFDKTEFQSSLQKRYHERFYIPLMLGFLALLAEFMISDRRK